MRSGEPNSTGTTLALALSGGGVAAVGHIPLLAAMEELGLQPDVMAGTSMGAVIAVCYGAGMRAAEIESHVRDIAGAPAANAWKLLSTGWAGMLSGTLNPEHVLDTILPPGVPETLNHLATPVAVVATDFRARTPVTFRQESTRKALAASIALPGVFRPLDWNGRLLVDGGVTNNLPVDVLPDTDATIAVDVSTPPEMSATESPSSLGVLAESVRIMMHAVTRSAMARRGDVILLQPASRQIGVLDLHRIEDALYLGQREKDAMKRKLHAVLEPS